MNSKVSIELEIENGIPKASKFEGNTQGFKCAVSVMVRMIAKSENKKIKDVFSELINAVAFAENSTNEMMEQFKKMMEDTNE